MKVQLTVWLTAEFGVDVVDVNTPCIATWRQDECEIVFKLQQNFTRSLNARSEPSTFYLHIHRAACLIVL